MLALLLAFRLLIPSGYMIAPDHHGYASLSLCGGPAQAAAQPAHHGGNDGHGADPAPSKPGERSCPYAALTASPLPPAPPALPPRSKPAAAAAYLPADSDLPRVAPAASLPPARGPPLLV